MERMEYELLEREGLFGVRLYFPRVSEEHYLVLLGRLSDTFHTTYHAEGSWPLTSAEFFPIPHSAASRKWVDEHVRDAARWTSGGDLQLVPRLDESPNAAIDRLIGSAAKR